MKTFLASLLLIGTAHAADVAPTKQFNMLPPDSTAVPNYVIQGLSIYLSDRSPTATELLSALQKAASATPMSCPLPTPIK